MAIARTAPAAYACKRAERDRHRTAAMAAYALALFVTFVGAAQAKKPLTCGQCIALQEGIYRSINRNITALEQRNTAGVTSSATIEIGQIIWHLCGSESWRQVRPNDALVDACKEASGENCNSGMDAVIKAIQLAMRYKPKGIRILLCCSVHGERRTENHASCEARNTAKTRELIMAAVPALTSALTIGKGGPALKDYLHEDDTNRLLVIDTGYGSTTMAGLNLQNTDLLLFDRLNNSYINDTARLVQSIGRIMRAQQRTPEQRVEDARYHRKHGRSVHAPKLLVFIDKAVDRS